MSTIYAPNTALRAAAKKFRRTSRRERFLTMIGSAEMSAISNAFSTAVYGLNAAANQLNSTSQKIAAYGTGSPGLDDLTQNIVDLSTEKTAFKANALVLKSEDQMMGTLLDIKA